MDTKNIKNPKVFISYAWNDELYQSKVLNFVNKLRKDGIETIFDKFELQPGNDTNAFLERSVMDDSVTNVLLLLDRTYMEKANTRLGGVGKETQVISEKVYKKIDQNKYIPIIFQKGPNGEQYKPAYLSSRFHIDLADSETFLFNYKNLVRILYGQPTYHKSPVGLKPTFIDEIEIIDVEATNEIENIKNHKSRLKKMIYTDKILNSLSNQIINFHYSKPISNNNIVDVYKELSTLKNKTFLIFREILEEDFFVNLYCNFLERIIEGSIKMDNISLTSMFCYEIFLYVVGLILKYELFEILKVLLNHKFNLTYFPRSESFYFPCIYSQLTSTKAPIYFKNYYDTLTKRSYLSGIAENIIQNVNEEFLSKDEIIFADIYLSNFTLFKFKGISLNN
jgi:hypothetical protein